MEFIDDHPVTSHRVRFRDRVEIGEADAEHVRDGAVVVWLVKARCQPPSYHPTKRDGEERFRFNIQKVEEAVVLHGVLGESALAYLADPSETQGYLGFEAPRYPELPRAPEPTYEPIEFAEAPEPRGDREEFGWDDSHVVGSVYGRGHEGRTQQLLKEAWGE